MHHPLCLWIEKEKNVIESMSLDPYRIFFYKAECEKVLSNYSSKEFCTVVSSQFMAIHQDKDLI